MPCSRSRATGTVSMGEGLSEAEIKEGLDRWFGHEDFRAGQ